MKQVRNLGGANTCEASTFSSKVLFC